MIWSDFTSLSGAVLLIVGALLPIVNPLGDAPLFLAMTPGCNDELRGSLAERVGFFSFLLLAGSMLFGTFVLRLFGLSIPIVEVAGGIVLCVFGWKMLSDVPKPLPPVTDPERAQATALSRAFYPLTMPLSVDAGAIAVAIAIGANHARSLGRTVIQILAAVIGAGIIALTIVVTYRYAQRISRKIGATGMTVLLRLSAFIMLCIGVSIVWNGVRALLLEIGIGHAV